MDKTQDIEYRLSFISMEAAQLALDIGINKVIDVIVDQYEELSERLADPRSYGPDRDQDR